MACVSWLILQTRGSPDGPVLVIAALSLSPLLGIERGNIDLFVFCATFLGCVAANRFLKTGAFFAAAQLKIFPFAGMIVDATRRPRREKVLAIAGVLLCAALFVWQWHDLQANQHSKQVSMNLSFGLPTLQIKTLRLDETAMACVWIIVIAVAAMAWVKRPNLEQGDPDSRFKDMFFVFGGIYLFTFLMVSNWDYRLIFLLPTLPLALEQARDPRHRVWGILYVSAVLVAENTMGSVYWVIVYLGDFSTIVIFCMIFMLFLEEIKNVLPRAAASYRHPATGLGSRGP